MEHKIYAVLFLGTYYDGSGSDILQLENPIIGFYSSYEKSEFVINDHINEDKKNRNKKDYKIISGYVYN